MPRLAQLLANRFLGQQVNIMRLSAGERDKVFRLLGQLQSKLLQTMDRQIPLPGFGTFRAERLNALYRLTDKLIAQQYETISARHDTTLVDVSGFASRQVNRLINASVGVPLLTVGLPMQNLRALVNDDLVDGRPAKYWWDQQESTFKQRYRDEIRQGVFAGENLNDLKRRIRGTREQNFQDGLMSDAGRKAETLIRTSVNSVANAARYETLKANDDVLEGHQWLTTLDDRDRTCVICMALSGRAWDFNGEPIGDEAAQPFPGPPPQHFNCRCTLVPVVKSWEQLTKEAGEDTTLAKKLDKIEEEMGPGTQASMDGQVAADLDYEGWLLQVNQESPARAREILGPGRYDLWQRGDIALEDLVDQRLNPLTLAEIRAAADLDVEEVSRMVAETAQIATSVESRPISSVTSNERQASSGSYVVEFDNGSRAMWKPAIEESPHLREGVTAGTYYQREAVAYDIAKIVDMTDLVPETVVREVDGQVGSMQAFVERAQPAVDTDGPAAYGSSMEDRMRASIFDYILGNTDRHKGNWMVTEEGRIVLIDHGLVLSKTPSYLRIGFIGGKTGQLKPHGIIPEQFKEIWFERWGDIEAAMRKRGIDKDAINLAETRMTNLYRNDITWRELEWKVGDND